MVVRVRGGEAAPNDELLGVWKPTRGERPLFDFPFGTLTRREVGAYLVSQATGWSIVPPTVLREGPFGEGMLQAWIEVDPEVDPVQLLVDDDDDGPDTLRVRLTASAARSFVERAFRVIRAGRPPCPLCGNPLDPAGHICPRKNGSYVH